MMRPALRNRRFIYSLRRHYRITWILLAVLIFVLWNNLPEPPKTENSNRMNRPTPQHVVITKPRFLHHSQFRENADHEYEALVDQSLREIENRALKASRGKNEADDDVIWQIMLGNDAKSVDRSPDSIAFEQANSDWAYKVISSSPQSDNAKIYS